MEQEDNIELFPESIFEMSSNNQNENPFRIFDDGNYCSLLKSNELENIISLDFVSKEREESFHLRNMLE